MIEVPIEFALTKRPIGLFGGTRWEVGSCSAPIERTRWGKRKACGFSAERSEVGVSVINGNGDVDGMVIVNSATRNRSPSIPIKRLRSPFPPMASPPLLPSSSLPEIGPDGIVRENPIIAYTERKIEAEQLQLKRYIQENYSKIRDVERELENLTLELKLTAGPKKAALEHLRKKIELATERIRAAKLKEDHAKKAWEAAAQVVIDEEEIKKKLCDDLNQLVQESTNTQITRLEELKRRLECLNPTRASIDSSVLTTIATQKPAIHNEASGGQAARLPEGSRSSPSNGGSESTADGQNQQRMAESRDKKRMSNLGRGKGNHNIVPKGRGSSGSGWTGAGFDVDGRT